MEVNISGDRTLELISNDSKTPTVFSSPIPGEGKQVKSVFAYAREASKPDTVTNVTVTFFDSDGEELEKTEYKVVVKAKK